MNHVELFSGVGGFRKAINLIGKDFNIPTNCLAYSEIDQYADKTYRANFDTNREVVIGDIVSFTATKKSIEKLPNFDFLTGGFPCQSFSMMGQQKGFKDIRGNVFFNIIKIIKYKKPKFILLENVKNLLTHNNKNTFKTIKQELIKVGYKNIYYDVFNSNNFDLAQKRNRVFIFATTINLPKNFLFNEDSVIKEFNELGQKSSLIKQKTVLDVLAKKVNKKYYLSKTIKPTILANGSKNFKAKSEINQLIARPLTATMVKMHRACQDNYYCDNFIRSDNPIEYLKKKISKEEQAKHEIRKLTTKEAFLLQGFEETFVDNAVKEGLSNHQLYKQAGNAVSVNTVYAVLHYLLITNNLKKYVL